MITKPTIYLVTNFDVNHNPASPYPHRRLPIDSRFNERGSRYPLYVTDENPPKNPLIPNELIFESALDPVLHKAGKNHLAEWSFLLSEKKHAFCSYPFFMISSRFYTKNKWLLSDLNQEWDKLFSFFDTYDHGFLPSYCRPIRWVKFSYLMNNPRAFFPFTGKIFQLLEDLYQIKIPDDYPMYPDLYCHYLGFKNRKAFLDYVNFYEPILDFFFTQDFLLKKPISEYVKTTGHYPNEKPLTFLFETLSHLYFAKKNKKFFCLHYDGYYEVDFTRKKFTRLQTFKIPLLVQIQRRLKYRIWWLQNEGPFLALSDRLLRLQKWVKKKFPRVAGFIESI